MNGNLEQELSKLKHGDHICLIYENRAEKMSVAVPFIRDGLNRGERCLYILDDGTIEEVVQALEAAGVDVAQERQRGALRLLTHQDTYLQAGGFVSQAMVDFLRQAEAEALADGFSGLRLTGEPTGSFGPEAGRDRLIEYEALLNQLPTYSKSVILCQYHHSSFDGPCIHDVLRTHPVAILGDQVCPNPYYELPEIVLRKDQPEMTPEFRAKRVDWWIAQLKRAKAAEQARERALEELKQTERRFAEAEQVAHIGSWERDLRTNEITWSHELYRLFGLQADGVNLSYQQFLNLLFPQDVDRIRALVDEAIRERRHFSCDYRFTHADGSVRVLHDRGGVILNEVGEPIRLLGTAQDVTELRKAEQAQQEYAARLQTLSRRVLEVQEEERRHLARELHDEIGQSLTALKIDLQEAIGAVGEAAQRLGESVEIVDRTLQQVRGMALDLRPLLLDDLGLSAALEWYVRRHTERTGIEGRLVVDPFEGRLNAEIETACFRVVQEALTNVARHARATRYSVELVHHSNGLQLVVRDNGVGFDPLEALEATRRGTSLGLSSMQERVELVGGRISFVSEPGNGTEIQVDFPNVPAHRPRAEEERA